MRKVVSVLCILMSLGAGFYAGICVLAPSVLADPSVYNGICDGIFGGIERGAKDGNAAAGPVGAIFGGVFGGVGEVFCIEPKPKYEGRSASRVRLPHKIDGHAGKEYRANVYP